ncbi:MAG: circadian clock protein KaiC [Methanomicrobiales archaeon]|nr:circadian clock protein KaiC [Methanomicrobiales archaeon]
MGSRVHGKSAKKLIFPKSPSGIKGLDEILEGGLPTGRPTLVCGNAGCGKTLLAMEFLVRGATEYNEPGIFMSFEESAGDLIQNVASLGFDVQKLIDEKKIFIDFVYFEKNEIEETGEYDLEPLFIRLGNAIDTVGAKRVALDTIESLFSGLSNETILRAELRRLFRWLKVRGVTAIITGESGINSSLTRHGLEEYVSDCVIFLDHRIDDQISTRRLRVVKYRGSLHGTNEYPFLIDEQGITVFPITSLKLEHGTSNERLSTGIERLDAMLEGKGFYKGSSILVSGTPGTGKTSVASSFAHAICRDGKKCLYFAFEESPSQIIRNMRSIGMDLKPWVDAGLLRFHSSRPTVFGLESHLAVMFKTMQDFKPDVVVVDPISNLLSVSDEKNVQSMFTRLIDTLKNQQVTTMMTNLTHFGIEEQTQVGISSLMDTWILLKDLEAEGERNRGLYVLKSRGMAHSNQIREFILSEQGISLIEPYIGMGEVKTGSARYIQETIDTAEAKKHEEELERQRVKLETRRKVLDAQIAALQAEFETEKSEFERIMEEEKQAKHAKRQEKNHLGSMRG